VVLVPVGRMRIPEVRVSHGVVERQPNRRSVPRFHEKCTAEQRCS
jgi:hypothetical protein